MDVPFYAYYLKWTRWVLGDVEINLQMYFLKPILLTDILSTYCEIYLR